MKKVRFPAPLLCLQVEMQTKSSMTVGTDKMMKIPARTAIVVSLPGIAKSANPLLAFFIHCSRVSLRPRVEELGK